MKYKRILHARTHGIRLKPTLYFNLKEVDKITKILKEKNLSLAEFVEDLVRKAIK